MKRYCTLFLFYLLFSSAFSQVDINNPSVLICPNGSAVEIPPIIIKETAISDFTVGEGLVRALDTSGE